MQHSRVIRIHIDTEFSDFVNTDLISIGLAASNGENFYGESLDFIKAWSSEFVINVVYPLLNPHKFGMKRSELSARIWEWIDGLDCDGVIISADYKTDLHLFSLLFDEVHPKIIAQENIINNIYYSCDEIIKAIGGSDTDYDNLVIKVKNAFTAEADKFFAVNGLKRHHALNDAQANRQAYSKIVTEFGIRA